MKNNLINETIIKDCIKKFFLEIEDKLEYNTISSTGIIDFFNDLEMYEYKINEINNRWLMKVNPHNYSNRNDYEYAREFFIGRANYMIINFFILNICKIPSFTILKYFKDGLSYGCIKENLNIILCEELQRKDLMRSKGITVSKKICSKEILRIMLLNAFSQIKQLFVRKK